MKKLMLMLVAMIALSVNSASAQKVIGSLDSAGKYFNVWVSPNVDGRVQVALNKLPSGSPRRTFWFWPDSIVVTKLEMNISGKEGELVFTQTSGKLKTGEKEITFYDESKK